MGVINSCKSFIINFEPAISNSHPKMKKAKQNSVHPNRNFTFGKTRDQTKNTAVSQKNYKPPIPPNLKKKNNQKPQHQVVQSKTLALLAMYHRKIDGENFQQLWKQFISCTNHLLTFMLFIPNPVNDEGEKLLRNGNFMKLWLSILGINPYINHVLVTQNAYHKYRQNITSNQNEFVEYCESIISPENATPQKPTNSNQEQSLKRSILKNSSKKKVQFKADEIIYPRLDQFHGQIQNSIEASKQRLRDKYGYLLDFLEINDIYLMEEIELVGLVSQIDNKYAIMLIRFRDKEICCIGVLRGYQPQNQDVDNLKKIEKQYQCLSFLDLEGKDPSNLLVNSLAGDAEV